MLIGIDARITSYNGSGISRYFWGLLSGLRKTEAPFRFSVLFSNRRRPAFIPDDRFHARYLFTPPHNSLERYMLPLELRRARCAVYHAMDFFMPARMDLPQILSVYDLYFLRDPSALGRASYRHYRRVREYVRRAKHVICCSQATRRDLLELTDARPERVSVVYPGAPIAAEGAPKIRGQVLDKLGLAPGFILFVGTIEPRKNISRLLKAYSHANQKHGVRLPPLVLVGRRGFTAERILSALAEPGLRTHVHYLGELPDDHVRALYESALFTVYPSIYEGFGFPLLEAMSAGSPLLASNVSSIPEVVKDAAYLVDPESVESISAGLAALSSDAALRDALRHRGTARCASFSWTNTARETLAVYEQVVNER